MDLLNIKPFPVVALILATSLFVACGSSSPLGNKVKEPFSGSKYESNGKWFRAVGKGESVKDNIARSKADLDAKAQLAAQVNTNIKAVADQYLSQTENANGADVGDKFQSLVREVMNTEIADLRKFDEVKYYNEETQKYTAYVAYEIKKNAMLRFMKKRAKTYDKIDERSRKIIEEILDEEIERIEALSDD